MKYHKVSSVIVFILFLAIFIMMYKGSTAYSYLEDDDSLDHSVSSSFWAETGSINPFPKEDFHRTYLNPYPPMYDIIMGSLYKFIGDIVWTLKFFNALIVALSIPIAFILFRKLLGGELKPLFATFLLAASPFMSHFIWSQTLAIPLMLLTLWGLLHLDKGVVEKKWYAISGISMLAVFFTQPSTAVFMLFFIIPLFWFKDWKKVFLVCLASFLLFTMTFIVPNIQTYGLDNTLTGIGISQGIFTGGTNVDTSGGGVPSLYDLVNIPLNNKIDQMTGIGATIFILALIGIICFFSFKLWQEREYLLTMIWFITFFILLYGNALPFKLFPHRIWVVLIIPVVLLATYGTWQVLNGIPNKIIKVAVLILIIMALTFTNIIPKWEVQNMQWGMGSAWSSTGPFKEMEGYTWFKEQGIKDIVMPVCYPSEEEKPISMGLKSIPYDVEVYKFRKELFNMTNEARYDFLVSKNIKYITIDHNCVLQKGLNETNTLINQLLTISTPVYANEEIINMKVN